MRYWLVKFSIVAIWVTGMTGRVSAIATASLSTSEQSPALVSDPSYNTFNWDYIYTYKDASAVAVDHYWILTAAHVADDIKSTTNLTINGEVYTQQEIVPHPYADLALVRYDKPLPGYYPLGESIAAGDPVLFCGYGFSGNVVSSRNQAYFTDDGSGNGIRRWGSNRIDRELTYSYIGPSPLGTTTNQGFEITISRSNSNAKTPYEAGGNIYDSGAGLFYNNGDRWELVGTMTTRTNNGINYTGNFAVATPYHVEWIKSVIVNYDTSMNGLPDWWEAEHSVSDAADDPDEDGFTNYEEWIADTDPNLGTSYLAVSAYTNSIELVFDSSGDRNYRVEFCDNLTNLNWAVEVDWFEGSVSQTIQSVSSAESNRFYRVRAALR